MGAPDLRTALTLHGLTEADLPGIRDAWDARFATLGEPAVPTFADVAKELLGDLPVARQRGGIQLSWVDKDPTEEDDLHDETLPGRRPVLVLHTRQGAGNREHWHDTGRAATPEECSACSNDALEGHPLYLTDFDADFDRTYAWHVFTVPPTWTDRLLSAAAAADSAAARAAVQAQADLIMDGVVGPWDVLATSSATEELRRAKQEHSPEPEWRAARVAADLEQSRRLLDILNGATLPDPGQVGMTERNVAELGNEERKVRLAERMLAKAHALTDTDPELAGWLFSCVQMKNGSYVEGTGRKKKLVSFERFDRGPLAEVEHRLSSDSWAKRAEEKRTELETEIAERIAWLAKHGSNVEWTTNTLPRLTWQLGWPVDSARACPPRPPAMEKPNFQTSSDL